MKKILRNATLGLVSASIIASVGLGGVKALDKLDDIRRWHTADYYNSRYEYFTQYNTEQLFVPSNPRLDQEFETNGHAYVFVHTGYLGSNGYLIHGNTDEYQGYMENVTQLIRELNDSGALVLYLIEDISRSKQSEELLDLLDNPFVLVTDYRYSHLEKYVKTESGKKEQKEDLVYSFLKDNGVKEVRFIGEMVWWGNSLVCLGQAAESFYKQGFKIRGVEGGVFPTTPSDNLWLNLDLRGRVESFYDALRVHKGVTNTEILDRIYTDAVVLK